MSQNRKLEPDQEMDFYKQMVERYEAGRLPWDSDLPPPEVVDLVNTLRPARALDLGCGYGRASIYLAQRGWRVDAVDFVPQAIEGAIQRAHAATVGDRIDFHVTSVTDLSFLRGPYEFALDVGCLHALSGRGMRAYRNELVRLLSTGASFLLFARIRGPESDESVDPPGLTENTIRSLFADRFVLEKVERGETYIDNDTSWASAWFWFRRI
jgi:cyclopropane fatty-acyl-phospholipid synthase-like methyltransferase